MNVTPEPRWFAIQSKPGQEDMAGRSIASLDLETLLPRVRRSRTGSPANRQILRPLFPNYLFARFTPGIYLHLIRYSRGVARVISAGDTPLVVEDEIISDIRARMDADGCVALLEKSWRPGDAVRIETGPLRGWSGIFERELDDHRRVVILLEAIREARVILERDCLEPSNR